MNFLQEKNRIFRSVTADTARPFLLARGYFTEIDILPAYVNRDGLDDINLRPLNWRRTQLPRTSSIDVLIEKTDKGLRRFSLLHPFIYLHLVDEVLSNLDDIKARLLRNTGVKVYSIPSLVGMDDISEAWKYFSRIDPAQHFLDYPTVVATDIYNFYGSIYTHSISWAIHGRDEAKNKVRDFTLLGNRLDKLFQNSQDGQTNGIPVGNIVSDLMAELVLKDIDEQLTPLLGELDIKAFRYRDDYRFVCKGKRDARLMLDQLALSLNAHYGLTLNQTKTKIYDVDGYLNSLIKSKALGTDLPQSFSEDSIRISGVELCAHIRALRQTNSRRAFDSGIKQLTDSLKNATSPIVVADDFEEWVDIILMTLIDAINVGYSVEGYVYLLVDFLISQIENQDTRQRLFSILVDHAGAGVNVARKLWIYAVLLNHDEERANDYADSQSSPLFKIASNQLSRHIDAFETRDTIASAEINKFDDFILINFDLFGRITGQSDILTIMEDDLYENMTTFHYDF